MSLDELIQRLEDIRDEVGGNYPVRGAFQPNYVLLADIEAITTVETDSDAKGVFIALGDGRMYGNSHHYEDDFVYLDEVEEDEDE
jgi:hypothetical protein